MCFLVIIVIIIAIASSGSGQDGCESEFGPEGISANATEYAQCVTYRDMDDDRRRSRGSFAGGAGALYFAKYHGSSSSSKSKGSSSGSSRGSSSCFVAGSLVLTESNNVVRIEDVALGDVLAGGGRVKALLQFDGRDEDL